MEEYRAEQRKRWEAEKGGASAPQTAATAAARSANDTVRQDAGSAEGSTARSGVAEKVAADGINGMGGETDLVKGLMELLPRELRDMLPEGEWGAATLVGVIVVVFCAGRVFVFLLLLALAASYLAPRRPSYGSFEPFFQTWFIDDYYPKVRDLVQRDLAERAKKESTILGKVGTFFKGLAASASMSVPASVWYEFWARHCLPPRHRDLFVARVCTVNLGTDQQPNWVSFVGIHGGWFLSPIQTVDVQNVALVQTATPDDLRAR
eukprot:gnl/TRDRNA2_/TRDRNA2_196355_c0_seq1.p1 gnl/TRDRNA2_/TRDRNA2_196355_c0~~gnl/TRDRNA2_/TRDRNA2_196355_c0_seq1.p1  ORF type:complete len:264 (+),score=38.40 gnl/TRDRNA2_/TRDRNA2_196355_c0_seq1:57-848(+)